MLQDTAMKVLKEHLWPRKTAKVDQKHVGSFVFGRFLTRQDRSMLVHSSLCCTLPYSSLKSTTSPPRDVLLVKYCHSWTFWWLTGNFPLGSVLYIHGDFCVLGPDTTNDINSLLLSVPWIIRLAVLPLRQVSRSQERWAEISFCLHWLQVRGTVAIGRGYIRSSLLPGATCLKLKTNTHTGPIFHGVLSFEWFAVLSHICRHIKKSCKEKWQNKQGKPINECWNLCKYFVQRLIFCHNCIIHTDKEGEWKSKAVF